MDSLFTANAIPITPSNKLRLAFWNGGAESAFTVVCRYQIENKDGTISQNVETFHVPNSGADVQFFINLAYGKLIAVTLATFNTTIQSGQLYATISLQYGNVNDNSQQLPLISGYVLANAPLNYPLGNTVAVNSDNPASVIVAAPDPDHGADLNYSETPTSLSELWHGSFRFTTEPAVATRTVQIQLLSFAGVFWIANATASQVASETKTYILSPLPTPTVSVTDVIYIPIPPVKPTFTLRINTVINNIQLSDQIDQVFFTIGRHVSM